MIHSHKRNHICQTPCLKTCVRRFEAQEGKIDGKKSHYKKQFVISFRTVFRWQRHHPFHYPTHRRPTFNLCDPQGDEDVVLVYLRPLQPQYNLQVLETNCGHILVTRELTGKNMTSQKILGHRIVVGKNLMLCMAYRRQPLLCML